MSYLPSTTSHAIIHTPWAADPHECPDETAMPQVPFTAAAAADRKSCMCITAALDAWAEVGGWEWAGWGWGWVADGGGTVVGVVDSGGGDVRSESVVVNKV